ncbi:MAG: ABC transporter permease [Gemmatimonas sp.]
MYPSELVARVRSLWRGLRNRDTVETQMLEEFRLHLELRTADLVRTGLTEEQAARQARLEFGHSEHHRVDARQSRGLMFFDQLRFSALDVKLGVRMLVKHRGLSLVSVIGLAVAIAMSAGAFSLSESLLETQLPLPEGDRIVALRNRNVAEPGQNSASLRDFMTWQSELRSVRDVAAFTMARRNLVAPGVELIPVDIVRITASGLGLARTAPIMGRLLLEEDERADRHVVVISFEAWRRRFASDAQIIGRSIGLGTDQYTIVGVMPEGFRFPVNDQYWIPLSIRAAEQGHVDAVPLTIAARLVDGATLQSAQAELNGIGRRMSLLHVETYRDLRPQILPYSRAFFGFDDPTIVWQAYVLRLFLSLLVVVVSVNVGILVYARTATRMGEIAVRTALGANRTRVVTQLFAEALALSIPGAAVGLLIASIALTKLEQLAKQEMVTRSFGELPFWVHLRVSPSVVIYSVLLAILGAAVVGVVPALKATGRHVQVSLQQLSARGATRMQLGRAWTTLIIAQVAVAVAVLPFAVHFTQDAIGAASAPRYPAERFLGGSLGMDQAMMQADTGAFVQHVRDERFRSLAADLIRRVETDPLVLGVTIRSHLDRERVEVELISSAGSVSVIKSRSIMVDMVGPNLFTLHDMPVIAGRTFLQSDVDAGIRTAVVNKVFARTILRDTGSISTAVGHRIRIVQQNANAEGFETGSWLQIVGVVDDFGDNETKRAYVPTKIGLLSAPIDFVIRMRAQPAMAFAPRLRGLAAAVDPVLQIDGLISADERLRQRQLFPRYLAIGMSALTVSVLLLSAAGIYAMMSFIVARRRREIGIRAALGADPRRVLSSIFARASAQIAVGILVGLLGTLALEQVTGKGPVRDGNIVVLFFVAALMTTIGLLAAVHPALRGLAIQPTEALREE